MHASCAPDVPAILVGGQAWRGQEGVGAGRRTGLPQCTCSGQGPSRPHLVCFEVSSLEALPY